MGRLVALEEEEGERGKAMSAHREKMAVCEPGRKLSPEVSQTIQVLI